MRASMTPREYGEMLAKDAPPLTEEQVREVVRILATVPADKVRSA